MEVDYSSRIDLQLFQKDEEPSIVEKIDYTHTSNGKRQLYQLFENPLNNIEQIEAIQQTLQWIMNHPIEDNNPISNGTILMIEKFYESNITNLPEGITTFTAKMYKWLNASAYSVVSYSVTHCFDFIKGWKQLIDILLKDSTPSPLKRLLEDARKIIDKNELLIIETTSTSNQLTEKQKLQLGYFFIYRFKHQMHQLLSYHAQIDAWQGMATAIKKHQLTFPKFTVADTPVINAKGLFHLLLSKPVPYDITLQKGQNFLFLTGANMAGKSTFIKSVGAAVFLAHIGMGVPAKEFEITLFDGLLSNINITDNINQGESYFFNEVQRIKTIVEKINNSNKWLILIDELFKGTNIQDAMK